MKINFSISILILFTFLSACSINDHSALKTATVITRIPSSTEIISSDLVEFAAMTIIEEQVKNVEHGFLSPEQSIIAYTKKPYSYVPIQVWRFTEGRLVEETPEAYRKAMGTNRADWPPFTYSFSFEEITSDIVQVYVETYYSMGLSESSRGGNGDRITITKKADSWIVSNRVEIETWD